MKSTSICPKCDGRKIYEVSPVQQTYCDAGGSLKPFVLTAAEIKTGAKGVFGGDSKEMTSTGPLNACVCAQCGFVEWYLPKQSVDMLEQLMKGGARVRVLPPSPAAPFR